MIRLRGISKQYRSGDRVQEVLQDLGLEVERSQLVAVLGRSGSGKTTLLNIIGGLETDYRGQVWVAGHCLAEMNDRRLSRFRNQTVGFVFQAFFLLEHLSSRDNVTLPALFASPELYQTPRVERERADELLRSLGLQDKVATLAHRLSGGERQRVAIARALFHRPPVLLCDEITGNLDRQSGQEMLGVLVRFCQEHAVTVVLATHDPQVAGVADRVLLLQDGRLCPAAGS